MALKLEDFNSSFYLIENGEPGNIYQFIFKKNSLLPFRIGTLMPNDSTKNCCGVNIDRSNVYLKTVIAGVSLQSDPIDLNKFSKVEKH